MPHEVIVFVTCPDAESMKIAKTLVEEKLAACVNVIPGVTSVFAWQGDICTESEELLLIKSTQSCFEQLMNRIKELHCYEIPEILCLSISQGYKPYMDWLNSCVQGPLRRI